MYAFFNIGISSDDVFSAIQDTDDMNDVVDSVGDGGPEGTWSVFRLKSKWPGGAKCDNMLMVE